MYRRKNSERLRDLLRARAKRSKRINSGRATGLASSCCVSGCGVRKNQSGGETLHLKWLAAKKFESPNEQSTWSDYYDELLHQNARLERMEKAVLEGVSRAPQWIQKQIAALGVLRGLDTIVASTLVAEVGHLSRFDSAKKLMSYEGISSLGSTCMVGPANSIASAITKTGNAHVRRVIIQAAWTYAKKSSLGKAQARRLKNQPEALVQVGHKARARLCAQYQKLCMKKNSKHAVVAVARELLGFVWAVGIELEKPQLKTVA